MVPFQWLINQVASNGDVDTVGVFFLGMMINNSSGIGDCSVCWDVANAGV